VVRAQSTQGSHFHLTLIRKPGIRIVPVNAEGINTGKC